jgi:hypothetical protein
VLISETSFLLSPYVTGNEWCVDVLHIYEHDKTDRTPPHGGNDGMGHSFARLNIGG